MEDDEVAQPRQHDRSPAPAPLVRRLLAFLIDLLPATAAYFTILGRSRLGAFLFFAAYHGLLVGATGATLGKVVFHLRVIQPRDTRVKWIFAFCR